MDKILTLVDGSLYSESVCQYAAWIAGKLNAGVDVMHVLGRREAPSSADLSGALRLGARSALLDELAGLDAQRAKLAISRGHAILEDAETILREGGVTEVSAKLRRGDLVGEVTEASKGMRGLVIGKRGEGADFALGHLGSNLERIVRSVTVPVVVASRAFRPIAKVLLAYDGSPSAQMAVERMRVSPMFKDVAVTSLCVGDDQSLALDAAQEAATLLKDSGLNVSVKTASGDTDAVFNGLIEQEGYDLLVMGAYGHSRVRSLIIGSTTTTMIQSVQIPVLLYR